MTPFIIAIGGPHGSGKSSVSKRLAETLNMNYVSAGEIFRQMANDRRISLEKFSQMVIEEPEIDKLIDDRTKELGAVNNTVVDAQLAAYFTPKDAALKICISASATHRWERIAKRENRSLEESKEETRIREETERKRFLDLYNIDVSDLTKYDVVINTDRISEENTYQITEAIVKRIMLDYKDQ
ncbi:MAG: cytidylate kinase family protein [Candidatus Heimdallarchaeota archaeon]|nr:cytidylate kinase family protein [Candidatus Heimdallarchaeota archaeon]MDH5647218.1 cytidylate kinase family protein [Candidatus Heimdallarchaeota archaeon]